MTFVLGHALYMKAIHGGKAKNEKLDAHKIAVLLRGGMLPQAYVYPSEMRVTRDLLRRRCPLARKRAELFAHSHTTKYTAHEIRSEFFCRGPIHRPQKGLDESSPYTVKPEVRPCQRLGGVFMAHGTKSQYNLPEIGKRLAAKAKRADVVNHFPDPSVHKAIEVDGSLIDHYEQLLGEVERSLTRRAKAHAGHTIARLPSVPGIGQILALVILYEIHDIPYLQPGLCGSMWTTVPEPARLIGPSLPLLCLVRRHSVPRGGSLSGVGF